MPDVDLLATPHGTPARPGEEDTVMRIHRLAAFAAISLFVAACGGTGGSTTGPTQGATNPASQPPRSASLAAPRAAS
jgi:hypothetical protein